MAEGAGARLTAGAAGPGPPPPAREHRCPACDRYLGRSRAGATGWVEIYCPRCKRLRSFNLGRGPGGCGGSGDGQS